MILVLVSALIPSGRALAAVTPSTPHSSSASTPPSASPVAALPKKPATEATFGVAPASASIIDGRPYFTFFADPGSSSVDHVAVENLSTTALPLNIYPTNATNAATGALQYAARSVHPSDAAGWIGLATPGGATTVMVAALSTIIVAIRLTVPAGASPGDHAAAIIVSLTGKVESRSGQSENLEQRLAARVFIRVSGVLHPEMTVDNLSAVYRGTPNPVGQGSVLVTYQVRNTGNVNLSGRQKVSLSGLFNAVGHAPALANVAFLLPGGAERVSVRIPAVSPELFMAATVHLTALTLAGTVNPPVKTLGGSAHFWAVPWTLLLIIVVLGLLIAAFLRQRRRALPSRHGRRPGPPPTPALHRERVTL